MAIKITGNTIISDTRELQNISNTDITTSGAINDAIKTQGNILSIYDSSGTEVRKLYCATETAVT